MRPTVKELREEASKSPSSRLHFEILMWKFDPPTYPEWVERVEEAIQFEVGLMAERRRDLHDLDEDALSAILNISLQNLNLDASAKFVNGNTDVTIQYNEFKWLGEAKFGGDVSKLYKGYNQLTTRYATGMPGQSAGGMLIYCSQDSADVVLAAWRAALEVEKPGGNIRDGSAALTFRSEDVCAATGAKLDILHIAFPLYHKPLEGEKKLSEDAIRAARAARSKVRAS